MTPSVYDPELLNNEFIPWDNLAGEPEYNAAPKQDKLRTFENWSTYARDYTQKRIADAPEDAKPELIEASREFDDYLSKKSDFLKNKHDLGYRISKLKTSEEVISALRDTDTLRQEGFSDDVIFGLRKEVEKEFAPILYRSRSGDISEDEAVTQLWEDPGLTGAVGNFASRLLPVIATAALKTVEGVGSLAEIFPKQSDVYGTGFDTQLPFKEMADLAKKGSDWVNETFPSDPRLSSDALAATEGLAQVPFNLATAAIGTVPNAAANYSQMYQENLDAYTPQITKRRYEEEIKSGATSKSTPFKQWESLLSKSDKEDIRAEAATKAMLFAVPQAAVETLADKFLLNNVPLPASVKSKLMSWRNARPTTYIGARVAANFLGKTGVEAGTEVFQQGVGNVGAAMNTGSLDSLTEGFRESAISGAFGGAGATALTLPNIFRTERAIDWAQSITNGLDEAAQRDIAVIKDPNADINSPEYKAAIERASKKERSDYEQQFDLAFINDPNVDKGSVEFRRAQKRIQAREDEAHWVLDRVGDQRADKQRAARYAALSDTRKNFENAFAKHIRENEPEWVAPDKELQARAQEIKTSFDNVRKGASAVGSNLDVDAAEKLALEQLAASASEKTKAAEKLITDFIGSVDTDGPGRALFARQELARLYPNSPFSPWWNDDATVVELLNARETGEIDDDTNPDEWLSSPAGVKAVASESEAGPTTPTKPEGLMTTGQRRDAIFAAKQSVKKSADPQLQEDFDKLENDLDFWHDILANKDSSEEDKAEARALLPKLEDALLELATAPVEAKGLNPNDQNQTPNQTPVPSQEVPPTSAAGQGTGTGEPFTIVRNFDGEEVIQTERDYINESREIVKALVGGQRTPEETLQNVEAVRQEIEAAPDLTPEQKTQWASHFQNIPALAEQQRAQQTTPNASTAPAAASGVSESTGSPELIAGEGTISESPTPVRMNSVPGDVLRTESGEVVFRSTADNTETVLRVKEGSIEKDPATLTVEDFEGGDGTPLVSEANKQFSVLPNNERPVRPFFRSEPQSTITPQDGPTATSSGSYPEDAGSTPAPATPAIDTAAITAGVQANPDIHRLKDGNRKLVSREAAVAILTQLPETFTNKDVAALAKDSGMTSPNLRKLAALRGDQNAVASILNGDMDAELGLFDDAILKMRQERAATKAPLNETTPPTTKVSNDTAAEPADSTPAAETTGQGTVDRFVFNLMAAFNEALSKMNESSLKVMTFRAQMQTEEGRAEIQRKLAGMAQTSIFAGIRSKGILDPVVEQEMAEKALYGSVSSAKTGGLTKNVQQDLLNNLAKTGDPFLTTNKDGDTVSYNAWFARGRNLVDRYIKAQNKRDKGTKNSEGEQDATDVENVASQDPEENALDPKESFKIEQLAQMRADAIREVYDRIAQRLARETGYPLEDARLALLHHLGKIRGVEIDPVPLGWKIEGDTSRVKPNILKVVRAKAPGIFGALEKDMKKALSSVLRAAEEQGLLSAPVIDLNNLTLESLIEASVYDEIVNGQSHKNAIAEAREKNSTSPLMPLLAKIDRKDVVAAVHSVLNNGKPFANSRDITALTQSDMQKVLDSGLLPARIQETLQALVDLSGDGMALLQNSKNEGWRRWSELLGEQMGNRAPVQVVFNLALDPAVTGQGLWQESTNTVHVSPFLTREQGLMESTLLHEMMHPVWDWKVTAFQRGDLSQLNQKEVAALTELQGLLGLVKAEADKKLAGITDKAALEIAKRDLLGSTDLREFLNEAINHKPFQDFLAELKDPDAKGKGSLFRRIVNAILKLIRGGDVAEDSILQRSFELSLDLANYTDRELPIAERNKTQAEYFKKLEAQRGRSLTPDEAANAAADFAFKYPQPRIANTRAEASRLAPQVLTAPELDGFLASQAYEFVSPNDLEEALDLNGAIRELSSQRQAQLRDFSNRVHEAFGMQGSTVTDAIGDWADGAEPTTVTEHNDPNLSYEDIKVMAALKGALRNQKAVIPFKVDPNGEQRLYDFFIPEKSIEEARGIVAAGGLEFRTLIEQNGGTRVLVFDADGSALEAFEGLIRNNNYESKYLKGSGEFLGSWDSREEGKETYTRTVGSKIASLGSEGRDLGPDSPEGIRIASLRSLAAEAGLTLGPVTEANIEQAPELAVVEALTGTAASQNEATTILESAKVNENGIRFIYTTGSRPTDYASGQENLGGAYEAASRDGGRGSQTDTGKSGSPKEEGARRRSQFGKLTEFAKANGLIMPGVMFKRFFANEKTYLGEGAEHLVYTHAPSQRVIKTTRADDIGDGTLGARGGASEYLGSLLLGNLIFGDDVRFEGLVQTDGVLPQVVLSQRFVNGRDATPKEIAKYMESLGFTRKEARKDVGIWEHKKLGVDVYDAVPNNVKRSVDGNIYVIDVDVIPKRPVEEILGDLRSEGQTLSSSPVSEVLESAPVPTTPMPMSALDVLYKDSESLPKPDKKIKNSAVATTLAEAALKYWGFQLNSGNITPEIEQILVNNGVEEFISALQASGKNAGDWYSTAIEVAMGVAGVIHPEISDVEIAKSIPAFASAKEPDKAAQLVMRIALAVTSQNLNVNQNAGYAEEQYAIFSSTGKFDSSKIYGEKAESISGNLRLANELITRLGFDGAEDFIKREFTVDDLQKKASAILGRSVKIAGKLDDSVNGAALFGPKIGQGFLQNLMGRFTPVTIDLWMRRTWGRWTGDVVGDGVTDERMAKLLDSARAAGLQLPEDLRTLRTVERKRQNGKPFKTMSSSVSDRLETDPEFRKSVETLAFEFNSKGQAEYRLSGQPVTPEQAAAIAKYNTPEWEAAQEEAYLAAVERGEEKEAQKIQEEAERARTKFVRDQQRVKEKLDQTWKDLSAAGKKPRMPKADWVAAQHQEAGRTEVLNKEVRAFLKPEWSRNAKVIVADLNPVDIPSPQDRRVITRVVNKIREELSNKGYTATNADVQAVLWYPEKDVWAKLRGEEESNLKLSYDDEFITIAEGRGLGEQAKALAERIRADRAARTGEPNDLRSVGQINRGVDETSTPQESPVRLSAPVPFQGNVTPGFNPSVYTAADRRQTTAFTRVLNDPEYQGIRNALGGKQYISYTVDETLSKSEEFLNLPVHNGDLKTAFYAAGNATGITAEQVVMTKALAIQRAQKAANNARASSGDTALPAHTRNSMDTLARHYQDLADEFADDLMSQASLAGQELRAFRMLADSLSPYSWVRKYKQPIVHTQKLKMDNDPVFKEMLERIKAARRDAANSTTTRMQKALAIAAKRFVKDTSVEEVGAYEKFARLLASNLSVREEVMQAATEMAVVSGMEAIRKAVAPGDKADPAFLKQWEDKLRSIASEQLNGIIESRLQGGMVDAEASPELTEEQKMAAREQKIMDAWRDFSDFPLAEMVFNLARSTIVASDSPYAALVRKAQFDPAKIKRLQQAVKMSINTAEEIRKSVADRNMSVESLVLRLQETNPSLSETEVGALAEAVKAVYDDEVQRASAAALQTIVNSSKRDPRKLTDAATISKLLPLVNMGAFKEEEVYNVLAEKFGLPTWSQENAEKIEAMANRVQALPEGSIERGETGQQMMLEILRANIKDSRGATRLQHMNQIASAIWTAGILSGPPTQIVNAAGTGLSVFLESFMDATGHFVEAKRRGVSTAQASEYYKDIARAWLFAFGKDANKTSLRAINEVHTALTRGASKFKSEKQEDLSTLELFKFDPRVAIPGNALMEAITTGEWKQALPQAGELGLGILRTVSERVVNRDAKGALKDYLATLKMVGRGMLATDAVNSFAATAAKEMMIKRTLMQTEGLTDAEVNRQMKEIRKGGEESVVAAAKAQAEQEATEGSFGPAGSSDHNIRKARRVEQLIEQMTYGNSVMEQGRDFAANATFNSEAYGLIGATMMTVFGNMNRYAGVVAKPINPFPKTVSNLLNTSLNYTLYGYARAMGWNMGSRWINEDSKYFRAAPDRGSAEFYAAHAKATAGTLALGALAMMLAQALKDREEKKEPFFEVHGPGPKDPKLRAQWAQSGHKPFTVRIGGLELRYTDWPGINIPLGMLGTVYDNLVHTNKEADVLDQLFIGVASVLGTTLDRNMLGGATALFDLMSKNTYDGAKEAALGKLVSSYTGGFLKPSFVRYLETVATGGYQDARSMRGWFLSQIPVVGALANNPAINVLGEPIKVSAWDATAGRLVSLSDTHPILSPLTTADLVIPKPEAYKIYDPSKTTMVRPMSAQEEYEYAATYGKIMKERLTPELVQSLTEQAKFAPQGAQDVLTNIAVGVRNQAQGELAAKRQIQKGKELKGP